MHDRSFIYRWIVGGFGLLAANAIVPGLHFQGTVLEFVALALIFGLVNAILKPLLTFLTCPLLLLTLGIFLLVLNGLLLGLTGLLSRSIGIHFYVDSFAAAFFGGIVISLVSLVAAMFFRARD
jgi:putative membrane protein